MKKMFYSEELDKYFESEEACVKAELEVKRAAELKAKQEEEKAESRKTAAKAVEAAEVAVDNAYKEFEQARKEATEIVNEAKKMADEILTKARKTLTDAQRERYNAIAAFNSKYGVYTQRYTGERARDEFNKGVARIQDLFDLFNF